MAGLLHHFGSGIEVLVDPVAKTHQTERIVFILSLFDVLGNAAHIADFFEHVQHGLVRAAVRRSPQRGNAGRDAGKRISAGRAGQPDCRGRSVLFMIRMQNEDAIHGFCQSFAHHVILCRRREHHM